ncbi:MAG TPA: hypothetical protein VKE22_24435 [Haliangiales bacterium]|nr:hypothetical protein [Haliangiales bacterium]
MASARELASLLDEIAAVDWRRPAWWGLVAGAALLERFARSADGPLYPVYLSVNGGPRSDTFMARDRSPVRSAGARAARAVARARAAAAAVATLDGQFPDQPLRCALRRRDGWLVREPATLDRAAFVTPRGVLVADLADERLAARLAAACVGPALPPPAGATAVAVSLLDHRAATARHLHRLAWMGGRGPWLGLGQAEGLEVASTCHFVVDGYGHGRIAAETFAALDRVPDADHGPAVDWPAPDVAGAEALGIAAARVPAPRTPRAIYALGRALLAHFGNGTAFSPTFQIPIAPGGWDDPERRRRRVLFALASLRLVDDERPEPFDAFARRLEAIAAREAEGKGVLTRILRATTQAPLPARLRRRLLTSEGRTHPRVPPIEVLAGRGSVSAIRYPEGERPPAPLYAVSSPALAAPPHDPRGAVVLTLVHHGDEATATLCGNGMAGTPEGARAFLDTWRAALAEE